MPKRNIKMSDVWNVRATYRATATCDGDQDSDVPLDCGFNPRYKVSDREVRQAAKEHVRFNPSHQVIVTVSDITTYYVPENLRTEED